MTRAQRSHAAAGPTALTGPDEITTDALRYILHLKNSNHNHFDILPRGEQSENTSVTAQTTVKHSVIRNKSKHTAPLRWCLWGHWAWMGPSHPQADVVCPWGWTVSV